MILKSGNWLAMTALLAGLAAPTLAAEPFCKATLENVSAILRSAGYRAEPVIPEKGDRYVRSGTQGTGFRAYLYICDKAGACEDLQFSAGFDLPNGLSAEKVNDWVRRKRYTRVWLDKEGDPYIELDMNLDGCVTAENVVANLRMWDHLLGQFKEHIGVK